MKLSWWMICYLYFLWVQNKWGQGVGTICMHTMSHSQKAISKLGINKLSQYKAIICTRKSGQKKGSIDVKVINGHLSAKFGPKWISIGLGGLQVIPDVSLSCVLCLVSQACDWQSCGSTIFTYGVQHIKHGYDIVLF